MKVRISIRLKSGLLDPQGKAVEHALGDLGFRVDQVRIGKLIELDVPVSLPEDAIAQAQAMCERLLVNPVMEITSVEVG